MTAGISLSLSFVHEFIVIFFYFRQNYKLYPLILPKIQFSFVTLISFNSIFFLFFNFILFSSYVHLY